jgi:hypothetical protein
MADKVIDVEIRTNTTGVKSLRQELRETTIALQQATDPALIERLQQKAGELKDTMADVNATIEATAGSATENLAKGLGKATSVGIAGFQGLISAQALFGDESKAVTETLVKLQALAGLSDALNSLGALGDTMTEIKASFIAAASKLGLLTTAKEVDIVVTEGQIVATEGATVATNVLGKTMNALPIIAIIAGLTAVVGAIAYFASQTEEAAISTEEFNEVAKTTGKALGEAQQKISNVGISFDAAKKGIISNKQALKDYNDNLGSVLGNAKTLEEAENLYEKRSGAYVKATMLRSQAQALSALAGQKYAETFEKLQNTELTAYESSQVAFTLAAKGRAAAEGQVRGYIAIKRKEAIEDLKKDTKEINNQVAFLTEQALAVEQKAGITSSQIEKQNSEVKKESTKKTAQELKEIQEKANAEYIRLQDERFKLENDLTLSETEKKKLALQQQYEKDIAIAGDDEGLIKLATKKLQTDLTQIDVDAEKSRLEKLKLIQDKATADAIAKEDSEFLRLQELTLEKADYEKLVLQQKYDAEYTAAEGNAELQIALKKKLEADLNAIDKESATKKIATEQEVQNAKLQMASDAFGALADLITATAGKDEKSQKKAFQINKAASIGQAIISTYLAANSALASPANNLFPGQAQIAAGVAIVGGMANVAKISRTQFGSGGGGGGNPPAPPAPSSTQQPSATPSFNLYGSGGNANNQNAGGANGGNGQNITVTAVVSETDMTNTQNRVNSMKSSASL